jgi:hypothetical protein
LGVAGGDVQEQAEPKNQKLFHDDWFFDKPRRRSTLALVNAR